MIIKKAEMKDCEAISHIHAASWRVAYKGMIPQKYLDELRDDFWVDIYRRWRENGEVSTLLIYDNEVPAGCVSFGKSRDGKLPEWGEIASIYLLPEYFGKGYGKRLLDAALSELRGAGYKTVYLWVLEDNLRARLFYEKNGFRTDGGILDFEIMDAPLRDVRYTFEIAEFS